MSWESAARTAFFVASCFFLGIEQRLWAAHIAPRLHHRGRAVAGAQDELQGQLQEEQTRLEEELSKLPPDSRKFFQELFTDAHQEMLVSPIVKSMQNMTFQAENAQDDGVRAAQRRYERFKGLESAVETTLWVFGGGVIVWCVGVALLDKRALGRSLCDHCLMVSHGWFYALSCLCALWAGLSLKNPWLELPVGFYLAPIAASAASTMTDSGEETTLRVIASLEAPAVCLALSLVAAALA